MTLITLDTDADLIKELSRLDNEKLSAFLAKFQSLMLYELGYDEAQAEIMQERIVAAVRKQRAKRRGA